MRGTCQFSLRRSFADGGLSVKQVVTAIAAETGEELTMNLGPRRPRDPAILVEDESSGRRDDGFQAC